MARFTINVLDDDCIDDNVMMVLMVMIAVAVIMMVMLMWIILLTYIFQGITKVSKLDEQFYGDNFDYDDDDDDNDVDDIKKGNENQVMINALSGGG